MMSILRRSIGLFLVATVAACAPASSLRVMTFNVRLSYDEGPTRWDVRRPVMVATIRDTQPDVVGAQELHQRQGDDLVRALPQYRWFGRDRRGGHADEHMGILYRTDRLRLVTEGDFWLSDTPEQPGSMSWGTDLPRMATWGVFETLGRNPRRFVFVDTHLPHREQDAQARERGGALILSRLPAIAEDLPLVVAGDFNAEPDSGVYAEFSNALTDAWTAAPRKQGPELTFHDFTGVGKKRIDYLFVRGFQIKDATVDTHHEGTTYASDHFPVMATVAFGK
ncbi:endonuclease/exonuclease/phosphatase family protein [Sphingomonas sp. ACRSK]|uniref:endonuclease/exonuclease/phosphatase family protein n=1 Tax=Sphingomonas sp. ACRSK TaxID=2918213 RepID=UPI001EF4F1AD|nr:endonuclease/exonuclease/phosphatase family protein [Sphingomonas sp. ACRSK]MCG7347657.1 endonuclease/exonuclease/phosphatase family protein [Sphingomonas sp. ACRSK]